MPQLSEPFLSGDGRMGNFANNIGLWGDKVGHASILCTVKCRFLNFCLLKTKTIIQEIFLYFCTDSFHAVAKKKIPR
jgi:hypothetical protein